MRGWPQLAQDLGARVRWRKEKAKSRRCSRKLQLCEVCIGTEACARAEIECESASCSATRRAAVARRNEVSPPLAKA